MELAANPPDHIWQVRWWQGTQPEPPQSHVTQGNLPAKAHSAERLLEVAIYSLAYLLEVSGDGSAPARAHTHTHSSLFLLLPQSVPKAIPDWISGINASEASIQWTHMSSIKGNPRLVIPNWVNRVACSRHMETTKHLKKMKTGNVLISCIKVPCS